MSADEYDITFAAGYVTPGRRRNNWIGSNIPGVADGTAYRWELGSVWMFGSNLWVCTDPAQGAAVWTQIDGTGGGGGMTNPMTTAGDIIRATTGGSATRLAIGTTGQVLKTVSGIPTWSDGWFDVTAYGATGDGSTDDTTAVSDAITALNSAGRGVLYFPAGTYKTSGGFTITANCTVRGDGSDYSAGGTDPVSVVTCTSQTAKLFAFTTADTVRVESIALRNTYGGTPSAGAGISVEGSSEVQRVDYEGVLVEGFYIDVDVSNGSTWFMHGCHINNPVSVGLRIANTGVPDAGDWSITQCQFGESAYAAAAAIQVNSSGGGKISGCKINSSSTKFVDGIDVNGSGNTSILLITNCSIENYTGDGVDISGSWPYIVVTGCQFGQYSNGTGNAIKVASTSDVIIDDCAFVANTGTPTAISLSTVTRSAVGLLTNNGFATLVSGTPTYDHTGGVGASVHITGTPTSGQVPTATSGTAATWQDAAGGGSLGDLSDVTLTAEASGDFLRYNGLAWVNTTLVVGDYPFHDEVLTDGSSNIIYAGGDVVMVTGVPN